MKQVERSTRNKDAGFAYNLNSSFMRQVTRQIVLDTLTKHETLTIEDIGKEENLGVVPDKSQLRYLLRQLTMSGFIQVLGGVAPITYTITSKGIEERDRLLLG